MSCLVLIRYGFVHFRYFTLFKCFYFVYYLLFPPFLPYFFPFFSDFSLAEGVNGELPNLDLFNSLVHVANNNACPLHLPRGPSLDSIRQLTSSQFQKEIERIEMAVGMMGRLALGFQKSAHTHFLQYV